LAHDEGSGVSSSGRRFRVNDFDQKRS
jgi:hypothetical protein